MTQRMEALENRLRYRWRSEMLYTYLYVIVSKITMKAAQSPKTQALLIL